jgi:transcriptional regulator with XRE-family HTH domain
MTARPRTRKSTGRHPRSVGKGDMFLGQRIRVRRVELKMSQAELGEKLGVSFQQIQKYEKGVNRVGSIRLGKVAEVLGVPISFFYESNGKHREAETLIFDDPKFSMRLIRAYCRIPSDAVRHQMVVMMEVVAGASTSAAA